MRRRVLMACAFLALTAACGDDTRETSSDVPASVLGTQATPTTTSTAPTTTTSSVPPRVLQSFGEARTIPADVEAPASNEPIPATTAVAASDSGTFAVGSKRGALRFADEQGNLIAPPIPGAHDDAITAVAFMANSDDLVSVGGGRVIRWSRDGDEWDGVALFDEPKAGAFRALAVSPDGATVATGGADEILRLWDVETKVQVELPDTSSANLDAPILAVAFSPDWERDGQGTIATTTATGSVFLLSASRAAERIDVASGPIGLPAFTSDGSQLVVPGHQWPWVLSTTSGAGGPLEGSVSSPGPVTAVAAWNGGDAGTPLVAIAGDDESVQPIVHAFTLSDPGDELSFPGLTSEVVALAFSPRGQALLVATAERVVVLPFNTG